MVNLKRSSVHGREIISPIKKGLRYIYLDSLIPLVITLSRETCRECTIDQTSIVGGIYLI